MPKRRFRQVNLSDATEIAGISSTALVEKLFVDVDNDWLYYIAEDGTPTIIGTSGGGGGANLSLGTQTATTFDIDSDSGTNVTVPATTGTLAGAYPSADFTKLSGIATGATANSTDAALRARSSHTGTQAISTVTNLQTELDGKAASSHTHVIGDVTNLQTELDSKAEVTHFQVFDDGTTGQATTTTVAVLQNIWGTPDHTTSDVTWSNSLGRATFNTAATVEVNAKATTYQTANNRHELHLQVVHWDGLTLSVYDETPNYASRNTVQREGASTIPGLKITVASGHYIQLRVYHVGIAGTVGASQVANQTRLSITLFK